MNTTTPPYLSKLMPARLIMSGWFFAGWSLIFDYLFGEDIEVNPALSGAPGILRVTLGILLVLGSTSYLLSTLRWKNRSTQWRFELGAYPLLVSGWLLYVVSIVVTDGFALFPLALGVSFIATCTLLLVQVYHRIRTTRRNYENLPEELKS